MTIFHLVRHADKASDPDLLTGRADGVCLSAIGREQAERLASRLGRLPLVRLLCSPMARARETAIPLARQTGLEVEMRDALTEMDFGEWTNRRCSELEPVPLWQEFNARRSVTRIPGGETMHEVQTRFVDELVRVHQSVPDGHVAVISHGDPIKAALLHFLGASLDFWSHLAIAPASISTVALDGNDVTVLRLNHELHFLGGN